MEIGLLTLGDHVPDPHTGRRTSQAERHANILEYARAAEPLGFDALLIGEHHFSDFIISARPSSWPTSRREPVDCAWPRR